MPTALIVEDEPEANKLLAMLVQLRGYHTESALDGAQAMDYLRKRVPDVVFLDLMLPDVDGYDICRFLKSSGNTSKVPVIIVTARITDLNRIESFRAGADPCSASPRADSSARAGPCSGAGEQQRPDLRETRPADFSEQMRDLSRRSQAQRRA